jgi:hypothetical protein
LLPSSGSFTGCSSEELEPLEEEASSDDSSSSVDSVYHGVYLHFPGICCILAPTSASASFVVSFLFFEEVKGEVHSAVSAGGVGHSKEGTDSAALSFEFFTFSGAETAGRGGDDKVGSASVAFGFFTFSRVEAVNA